jgi:hypothetical protein
MYTIPYGLGAAARYEEALSLPAANSLSRQVMTKFVGFDQ